MIHSCQYYFPFLDNSALYYCPQQLPFSADENDEKKRRLELAVSMKGAAACERGRGGTTSLSSTQAQAPLLLVVLLPMLLLFVEENEGQEGWLVHNVHPVLRSSRSPFPRKQWPGEHFSCVSLGKGEGKGFNLKRRRRSNYHQDTTSITARGSGRDAYRRSLVGARGGGNRRTDFQWQWQIFI